MLEIVNTVLLTIVFLVPGFIFRSIEGQFVYLDKRLQWERFALGLLARSTFVYLPIAPYLYRIWTDRLYQTNPAAFSLLVLSVLLILPSFLGLILGIMKQKQWGSKLINFCKLKTFEQHQIPSAWDHLFSDITPSWVIVRLKDGHLIRGYLGINSYVSSDHDERDIYISHVLTEESEDTLAFVKDTKGVYLKGDDISTIEFIENNPQQEPSKDESEPK